MPIYEFYCADCNTIFNFFSRRINTTTQPLCPSCKERPLQRQMSTFAVVGKAKEAGDDLDLPVDEARMGRALEGLARETEGIDENDPRQMALMMRKFSQSTGLPLGAAMEEALARMEAGEDPDRIEDEMGDMLEFEEPFATGEKKGRGEQERARPLRDETLYEL